MKSKDDFRLHKFMKKVVEGLSDTPGLKSDSSHRKVWPGLEIMMYTEFWQGVQNKQECHSISVCLWTKQSIAPENSSRNLLQCTAPHVM
jgi:hypothetical protein